MQPNHHSTRRCGRIHWFCRTAAIFSFALQTLVARDSGWISLFDGTSLTGWKANENAASWAVRDGSLVTQGDRSHLFYTGPVANHNFKNFELVAEVKTTPGSNSGIYVHTRYQSEGWPEAGYELQVINSNPAGEDYVENKMTGSIYAIRNTWQAPARDNEWFEYRIVVSGKTLQTYINGNLICQYTESETPYRPSDKKGRLLGSGTFALQAHDPGSVVFYRSLRVRLLPDDAPSLAVPLEDRELDVLITKLSNDNLPLIDLGLLATSPGNTGKVFSQARRYGLTIGQEMPIDALARYEKSIVIVNDRAGEIDPSYLRASKAAGARIAFSSGGAFEIDEARLKRRLQAIQAADLKWQDFWVPGKD
ncbi:MAG: DUF1080 domain-containing protein [Verrucomicrobia bacterium]|nr:DUF1080 domain-containing protein [Verrucomicrobiota bacterium]